MIGPGFKRDIPMHAVNAPQNKLPLCLGSLPMTAGRGVNCVRLAAWEGRDVMRVVPSETDIE